MNTVLKLVSICPMEQNILIPAYFDVPFQGVLGFLKKDIYILIQHKIINSKSITKYQILQIIYLHNSN